MKTIHLFILFSFFALLLNGQTDQTSTTSNNNPLRTLQSMEELICAKGESYFHFEIEKDQLLKLLKKSKALKKYCPDKKAHTSFHRLDILIDYRYTTKKLIQLVRLGNYACRKVSKCKSGDQLTITIKEFINEQYTETIKVIHIK